MKKKILYLLTTYLLYGTQNIQSFRPFIPIFFHFKCVVFHVTQLCNFVHIVQLHDNFQVSNDYEKKLTKITRLFTYICLWSRIFLSTFLPKYLTTFFWTICGIKKIDIFPILEKNEGVSAFCHIDPEINFSGYLSTNFYQQTPWHFLGFLLVY